MTCKNWRVSRKTSSFIMEIVMRFLAIVLTIIFAIARIMGLIGWSWWLVLSPALIYFGFILLVILITTIACIIANWLD